MKRKTKSQAVCGDDTLMVVRSGLVHHKVRLGALLRLPLLRELLEDVEGASNGRFLDLGTTGPKVPEEWLRLALGWASASRALYVLPEDEREASETKDGLRYFRVPDEVIFDLRSVKQLLEERRSLRAALSEEGACYRAMHARFEDIIAPNIMGFESTRLLANGLKDQAKRTAETFEKMLKCFEQ